MATDKILLTQTSQNTRIKKGGFLYENHKKSSISHVYPWLHLHPGKHMPQTKYRYRMAHAGKETTFTTATPEAVCEWI